jgi:DNA-binding MarR family transcriptional regulator
MRELSATDAITELMLTVFRLNGQLLNDGDRLTKPIGLTSARWQVLGAINLAGHPLTVSQIGRRMGISRQAVQRVANDLEKAGFATYEANPDHVRAKLVTPTKKGWAALEYIGGVQTEWASTLAVGFSADRLNDALTVLQVLYSSCEALDLSSLSTPS